MATVNDRDLPVPGWVARRTAAVWAGLSALRNHSRIFHPRGEAFDAVLDVPGGAGTGTALFDERAAHAAIVRISRGIGWREPLPDTIGLGIRLLDAHGDGRHQDFLINTSADLPVLHHLFMPAVRGTFGQTYSSILAYRIGDELKLVGALPGSDDRTFELALAPVMGRFEPVATLRLGRKLPTEEEEGLRFNPWHTGGGIRPAGPFQGIRSAAYRGSQEGRGAAPRELTR